MEKVKKASKKDKTKRRGSSEAPSAPLPEDLERGVKKSNVNEEVRFT